MAAIFRLSAAHAAEPAPKYDRLPRTNLVIYRGPGGAVATVESVADWQRRRAEILEGMQQVMGPFPGKTKQCPLAVKVEEETDCDSYLRRLVTYASEPGSRVPAFLLVPKSALKGKDKLPAILALHPTDMQYGHRVTVEELRAHYRAYARDLAERGFVVLAPSYPLMANYEPDLKALGYKSGTMKAIWDNIRAMDLLDSLKYVKRGVYGAIGHSLGGHNAIYTAVFDERIRALVSSCGFDSYLHYMEGNITGWTSERYMPALLGYKDRLADIPYDFHELIGALAPRPVFVSAPLRDGNFKWRSVDEVAEAALPVYRLYGLPQNLQVLHPDCEHDFPPDIRERAYEFLDKQLRQEPVARKTPAAKKK